MASNRAVGLQVVDPLLTRIARNYRPQGFIADELVPEIPVSTYTGKYVLFTDQYWFQSEVDTLTADRAPTREIDYEFSTDTFSCDEHGLKVSYTDAEVSQAPSVLDLRRTKVEFLAHRLQLAKEIRIAALLDTISNGGQINNSHTSTPSNNWDVDTATIEADIKTGVLDIYDTIGRAPNTIVIPYKVAYAMALQQDIREILKYTVDGTQVLTVGDRVLPSVLHGMRVVIPKGVQKDSAREGGTASRSEIWGDEVRLLYVNPSASTMEPSVAVRFRLDQPQVVTYRTNDPDVTYVKSREKFAEKVVAPDAAYILRDLLS